MSIHWQETASLFLALISEVKENFQCRLCTPKNRKSWWVLLPLFFVFTVDFVVCLFFLLRQCCQGWPEFATFLPQLPSSWDFRCVPQWSCLSLLNLFFQYFWVHQGWANFGGTCVWTWNCGSWLLEWLLMSFSSWHSHLCVVPFHSN